MLANWALATLSAAPVGTAFTYQGHLSEGGAPCTGLYEFRFSLFDGPAGGRAVAGPLSLAAVAVTQGVFSVVLDFGAGAFTGEARWLELDVRAQGSTAEFTALAPRQALTPTPYAWRAASAGTAGAASNLLQTLPDTQLSSNVVLLNSSPRFSGVVTAAGFQGDGAGLRNLPLTALGLGDAISPPGLTLSATLEVKSTALPFPSMLMAVTTADVNADGWTDLIATSRASMRVGFVTLFTNDGRGGFVRSGELEALDDAAWTIAADLNRDGLADLVTAHWDEPLLTIRLNQGQGRFTASSADVNSRPYSVVAAEVNGDGWLDLVTANGFSFFPLTVLTNQGNGRFEAAYHLGSGEVSAPRWVAAADVNRDGWTDLAARNQVWTNDGHGGFVLAGRVGASDVITSADFNRDGWMDWAGFNTVFTNDTHGGWAAAAPAPLPAAITFTAAADMNGDGWTDLVSVSSSNRMVFVSTNDGRGGFALAASAAVGPDAFRLAVADLNGDGRMDVVTSDSGTNQLSILVQTPTQFAGDFRGRFRGDGSGLTNLAGSGSGTGMSWQVVNTPTQTLEPNRGYLLTRSEQVTCPLPASVAIGDRVRVAGVGQGGWKLAQHPGQSILGRAVSQLGAVWTPRTVGDPSLLSWRGVAASANGEKLAACQHGGFIHTSTNGGQDWVQRESARAWSDIASSRDGAKLVACVGGGQVYVSTNSGEHWTARETARSWSQIASSADGTRLLACSLGAPLFVSTDSGGVWFPRESARNWTGAAISADGQRMAACADGGQIYLSTDSGVNWTPRETVRAWSTIASSGDGMTFVAGVHNGSLYVSIDGGSTWESREGARQYVDASTTEDGQTLVAVSMLPRGIFISTDAGYSWTRRGGNSLWQSVAVSPDGSRMLAGVYAENRVYVSSINTTPGPGGYLTGGQGAAVELLCVGEGRFLPLSHAGTLFTY